MTGYLYEGVGRWKLRGIHSVMRGVMEEESKVQRCWVSVVQLVAYGGRVERRVSG